MSAAPDYLEQVREFAESFEVFGELGRKSDQDVWFLARERGTRPLVALRLHHDRVDEQGDPVFVLEVARQLGSNVAMSEGDCQACGAGLRSFARFCSRCGADQTEGTRVATTDAEGRALLEEVRAAASELYDVLGEIPWVSGAGTVYFAVERSSGTLVRLRLRHSADGMELGETQVSVSLSGALTASYVTRPEAPAVTAADPPVTPAVEAPVRPVVEPPAASSVGAAVTPVVEPPAAPAPAAPVVKVRLGAPEPGPGAPQAPEARRGRPQAGGLTPQERRLVYVAAGLGVVAVALLVVLLLT